MKKILFALLITSLLFLNSCEKESNYIVPFNQQNASYTAEMLVFFANQDVFLVKDTFNNIVDFKQNDSNVIEINDIVLIDIKGENYKFISKK